MTSRRPVLLDFERLSATGVYVTPHLVSDVKHIIRDRFRTYRGLNPSVNVKFFVHIKPHGVITMLDGHENTLSLHETKPEESGLNCGMRGCGNAAEELERMILRKDGKQKNLVTLKHNGQRYTIADEDDLRRMNHEVFGSPKYLAGDLVKSIVDLRRHAREQKTNLRKALDDDAFFRNLEIKITAGVQNYDDYNYVRVDGNVGLWTPVDEIHQRASKKFAQLPKDHDERQKTAKQTPEIILFHPADIKHARVTGYLAANPGRPFTPNKVFAISGTKLHEVDLPLDPYKTMGLYYAIKRLNAHNVVFLGHTKPEAEKIMERVQNDPYAGFVLEKFNPNINVVSLDNLPSDAKAVQEKVSLSALKEIPKEVEVHVEIGCSDARDIGSFYNEHQLAVITEAKEGKLHSKLPKSKLV